MRRDAQENRAALLAAARVVLNRDPDATLDLIAAEAGLSRRSVYGHFANRDELLRELVTAGTARVASVLLAVEDPRPIVRLALIAARMWAEVEQVRVTTLFAVRGPYQDVVATELEPLRARLRSTVEEGAGIRSDISPTMLARLIESAALAVLDEATRAGVGSEEGHRLVMLLVLSTAGLDADAAGTLIDTTPELAWAA